MATLRVVPAFDEVENGHARFGLGAEAPSLEQLAFEGGGNALAKGLQRARNLARELVRRDDTTRLCAFTRDAAFQPLDRVDQRWRQDGVSESAQFVVCR